MKSFPQLIQEAKKKTAMDKRGIVGLDVVAAVFTFLIFLVVLTISGFLVLVTLQNSNIFTAGSRAANDTNNIILNTTTGAAGFFTQIPTIFTVLGVVVLLAIVAFLLVIVLRFRDISGGQSRMASSL